MSPANTTADWRVVETRYDHGLHVVDVITHSAISGVPMSAQQAKAFAAQEMGRFAGVDPKRTFRAEPVPAPLVVSYESSSGSTIAYLDGVKFGAVWGPAVDDQQVWFAAWHGAEPHRVRTREAAERELSAAVKARVA